jgi:magnesium transporter
VRSVASDRFLWRHADDAADSELTAALAAGGYSRRHVQLATERNLITLAELDDGRLFLLLQVLGKGGRLFQLSLFVDDDSVVSVLGPRPEEFEEDAGAVLVEELITRAVTLDRPRDLVAAAFDAIAAQLEEELGSAANAAGALDREMRTELPRDPERFLSRAFSVRHHLVTVGNRITQTREACGIAGCDGIEGRLAQLRIRLDGEAEFLQGVLDYYQSLTNTKMNIAMERLAVIAAVTLPVSAIGGILGMNTIVSDETNVAANLLTLVLMMVLTVWMLLYARRRGWW